MIRKREVLFNIMQAIKLRDYVTYLLECYKNKVKMAYAYELAKCKNTLSQLEKFNNLAEGETDDDLNDFFSYYNMARSQLLFYEKTLENIKK